jgi:predicted nucleic acid-binding Zn ribbon protein
MLIARNSCERNAREMDKLIKTLPAILQASVASEEVAEAACIAAWKHAVGEGLISHAVPLQLQNKTLVIVVEDDIWKRQLEQIRSQLLFRLNAVLGQALVKSIELRIDPKMLSKVRRPEGTTDRRREYLNDEVPAEVLSAAAGIKDVELRRAFLGAATSCIKRLEKSET